MAAPKRSLVDILVPKKRFALLEHEEDSDEERRREEEVDEYSRGAPRLPCGVTKRVIREAPVSLWQEGRPKPGDKVSVHFVAKLSDGTQVGSSREKDEPFRFVIDEHPRQVVLAMELAAISMRRTEIAEFKVIPRFAYDDLGSPPLIPPNATMIFEVELLGWQTQEDLFGDTLAIKTVQRAGRGERKPERGDEVVATVRFISRKQEVLEDHPQLEHVVGDPIFGPLSRLVVTTLMSMTEGEKASVFVERDAVPADRKYARGTLEVELERIFDITDISLAQDRSLVKKVLTAGADGAATAPEAARVKLRVESATDGTEALYGFSGPKTLQFVAGDGDVCDALELAALAMKPGERATLTCSPALPQCMELELGLVAIQAKTIVFTVELLAAEGGDTCDGSKAAAEQLEWARRRKEAAAGLYRRQRYVLALRMYTKIVQLLGALAEADEASKGAALELRLPCELNRAACLLKLGDSTGARSSCDEVLRADADNVKALFRRASALFALSNYGSAAQDLSRVLALDPRNSEARALFVKVREAQKTYAQSAKKTATRMMAQPEQADTSPASTEPNAADAAAAMAAAPSRWLFLLGACTACLPAEPCMRLFSARRQEGPRPPQA